MSNQILSSQKKEHIWVININGEVSHQEGIAQLSAELLDASSKISEDEEIRVIIFSGSGENPFHIETDLFDLAGERVESAVTLYSITEPIAKLDRPTIAAINGNAIGEGLEMALACDLRIAAENSHFGLCHIPKGVIPWNGGTQRLSRLVGRGKAMEMILTGEVIDAHEAYRIGLVNKVVPPGELTATVMNLAEGISSGGPIALKYAKEAIHKGMDMTLEQGLRLEADLYFLLHTTIDRTEGITAFRDKKKPKFEGR